MKHQRKGVCSAVGYSDPFRRLLPIIAIFSLYGSCFRSHFTYTYSYTRSLTLFSSIIYLVILARTLLLFLLSINTRELVTFRELEFRTITCLYPTEINSCTADACPQTPTLHIFDSNTTYAIEISACCHSGPSSLITWYFRQRQAYLATSILRLFHHSNSQLLSISENS